MDTLCKILTTVGSVVTICLGLWHFFVPKIWNWYSYISPNAPELITAVRAINIFFSLCLVLFGVVNILFINGTNSNRYSIIIMLSATSILWLIRSILQIIYPQGSLNPAIQYGMLALFIATFLCFLIPLFIIFSQKKIPLRTRD
jgi:hypothetical protein